MEPGSFPTLLRERRTQRRLSQLDLALRAGTTQRHVSFMESGRSTPGRAMVVRLTEALQLPLRERNHVLVAAGFAPAYAESEINGPNLAPVRAALHTLLDGHGPYPAVVVGRPRARACTAIGTSAAIAIPLRANGRAPAAPAAIR